MLFIFNYKEKDLGPGGAEVREAYWTRIALRGMRVVVK